MREVTNDYELVSLAQENNEDAIELLYQKYTPILRQFCKRYFKLLLSHGTEDVDVIQDCFLIFDEAIYRYSEKENATFYSYVKSCIDKHLVSLVRSCRRLKFQGQNEAVSLEELVGNENISLEECLESYQYYPEDSLYDEDAYQDFLKKITGFLSPFEECVLLLKIQDYDYLEIASILDKDFKSIYNTMRRIRIKVKNMADTY